MRFTSFCHIARANAIESFILLCVTFSRKFLQIKEFIILNRNFSFVYLLHFFLFFLHFINIPLFVFVRKLDTLFSYDANMQIFE